MLVDKYLKGKKNLSEKVISDAEKILKCLLEDKDYRLYRCVTSNDQWYGLYVAYRGEVVIQTDWYDSSESDLLKGIFEDKFTY